MDKRWPETAAAAAEMFDALPEGGSVLAKRAEIAARLGITKETLHNYIEALRFVEQLRQAAPEMAAALTIMSATSVGVYGRWWRRDPDAAARHAAQAAREGWPAARIAADEKKMRMSRPTPDLFDIAMGTIVDEDQRRSVSPVLRRAYAHLGADAPALGSLRRSGNRQELSRAMGATEALVWTSSRSQRPVPGWMLDAVGGMGETVDLIAVMEIDRGAPGDAHRRNARNMVARAALAARVHAMTLVLVPDATAVAEFVGAVPVLADHRLAEGDLMQVFGFGPACGLVAVGSAADFAAAWSGRDAAPKDPNGD